MSYLVLARKYRPRNFSQMVGQTHVVQALSHALQSQRLHHAYLFTGTRGVGKTTVSRILAKSLNCLGADGQGGITDQPCGVCAACSDIDAGRFVDYTELDAASNRGVDEIAQLLEQAVYKPVVGRFKVFMIDEVHMLTNTAFNAMLKTLEEPPAYLKFVLATTDPQKVPATVLSRCLQFNLRPMAPETIVEHLAAVLHDEQIGAEVGALRLLARAARGSMRDALSLTDQAIAFGSGRLEEAVLRQMLGTVERGHVYQLIQALADGDGRQLVDLSEMLRRQGLSAASTLEEMTLVLQRMAVVQAVGELDDADPEQAQIADLARGLPPDETQLLYSLCLHGRGELGLAPDEYAALTMVLLRLLPFKRSASAVQGGAVAPPKKPRPEPPMPAPRVVPTRAVVPEVAPWEDLPEAAPSASAIRPAASISPSQAVDLAPDPPVGVDRPMPGQAGQSQSLQAPPELVAPAAPEASGLSEIWRQRVHGLLVGERVAGLARELALQSQLVRQDGPAWTLRVERQALQHAGACEQLLQALRSTGEGAPVQLLMEVGPVTDSQAMRLTAAQAERQRQAEAIIESDPFVQDMMAHWGARIVPGSIKPWSAVAKTV
jgi:DNA polymerase III subunit gamma/tau